MKLNAREKAFALKHFTSQRRMASVDVFGRQLTRSVGGSRGPPGERFKITLNGQYDMDNRRLCNLADPTSNNDAVSMRVMQSTVQQEVRLTYAVTSSLRNDVNDTSVMIRMLQSQFQESLKNQRINNETFQDLAVHNSRVIAQLHERLRGLERSRENDDNSSTICGLESSIKEAIKRLDIKQKADTEALQDLAFRNSQIISRLNDRLSALEHGEGGDSRRAS